MQPEIKTITEKKLIGKRIKMSLINNKTYSLWNSFMPRRKEIKNNLNSDLFSLRVYPPQYSFSNFDPNAEFEKWALTEVTDFDTVPNEMETFTLPAGLNAVFHYKGLNTDTKIYEYIHGIWIPRSDYELDQRPHFEIMGAKYINNSPDSEEEIWIPVKKK